MTESHIIYTTIER